MKALKILLLYPEVPQTFWSLTYALEFFGKRAWSPPLGLLTVAAMLPQEYEQRLRDVNVEPLQPEDLTWADYAFISAMDVQRQSARRLINRCKRAGLKVVVGGPLFTSDPNPFSDVDHLVLNEAEVTLPQFLADLEKGEAKPCYSSQEFADVSTSPLPDYQLVNQRGYGAMSLQFSRGCPYQCEFCDVTTLFGRRPRSKTAAQILAELDNIYQSGWRGKIYFVDDNIMGNRPYLKKELLPAIIQWRKGKRGFSFHTQITMNLADDQEMIDQMYEAGFDWIFIGIETPDEGSLTECNKKQNLHRNLPDQVRHLQRSGLQVQGGFIVGFDRDPPDIFRRQFEFIQQSGIVMAMVGVLQAPTGTDLYKRMKREGRLLGDFSGNNVIDDTNIRTVMDPEYLKTNYRALVAALYEPKNYYDRVQTFLSEYKEPKEKPPLTKEVALAVLRCFFWLGLVRTGRSHFWRVFWWALLNKRDSVTNFIGLAILGYHFRKIHEGFANGPQAQLQPASEPTSRRSPLAARAAPVKEPRLAEQEREVVH